MFSIPPVERRRNIPRCLYPRFHKEHDDTYLAYVCFGRGVMLSLVVLAAFLLVELFRVDSFLGAEVQDWKNFSGYNSLVYQYPKLTAIMLILIVVPAHVLILQKNSDLREADLLWWNEFFSQDRHRTRSKILFHTGAALVLLPVAMYFSFAWPHYVLLGSQPDGLPPKLSLTLLFYITFNSWCAGWLFVTLSIFIKYSIYGTARDTDI